MKFSTDQDILAFAEKIRKKWKAFQDPDHQVAPYFMRMGYLKRALYGFANACMDQEKSVLLHKVAKSNVRHYRPSKELKDNPYFAAICLVLNGVSKFPKNAKHQIPRELAYARKHDVPKEFLIGFLMQSGGYDRLIDNLRTGKMERWWVRKQEKNGLAAEPPTS